MTPTFQQIDAALTAAGQPFEVVEQELRGVRVHAWKHAPPSLREVLLGSLQHSDKIGLVYEDERLTYAEHFRRVAALAEHLIGDCGVTKGDRVAIAMRNYPEWSIAFWATAAIGAVAVPLNAWWTGGELEYGLVDSGSKVLIVDQERLDRLADVIPKLDLSEIVVARGMRPGQAARDFAALVADGGRALPNADIAPDDLAMILYTSGTTGQPKGAALTHRNICNQVMSGKYLGVRSLLRAGGKLEDLARFGSVQQSTLLPVPLFHVTGCVGVLVNMLAGGGKSVLMYKWDAGRALDLIERERLTMCACVPTMAWQLTEVPGLERRDLSSLLAISYGGAPAAPELMRRLRAAFPACAIQQRVWLDRGGHRRQQQRGCGLRRTAGQRRGRLADLRSEGRRPRRTGSGARGTRRVLAAWPERRAGVLEPSRRDLEVLLAGLVSDRRRRSDRRAGIHLHRRPHQGHDHPGRRERLLQ